MLIVLKFSFYIHSIILKINFECMFSALLNKLYWPCFFLIALVLLMFIFLYFYQINNWSDRNYYNWMNFKRIFLSLGILVGSYYMKHIGNDRAANLILYIPIGIFILVLIGGLIILLLFMQSGK